MLDTLMVLWTRGIYGRFLQALAVFLLLFLGICVLIALVMASGVRWPGLAVTAAPPADSAAASTPTLAGEIVPVTLQNPTPEGTRTHQTAARHIDRHRRPGFPTLVASPTPWD